MKISSIIAPITILLTLLLLAAVIWDTYTYAWNTNDHGHISPNNGLQACIPWNLQGCKQLWTDMGTHHKIALILHLISILLIISLILIMTFSAFTRVIRKRTSIIILIIFSWLVLVILVAVFVLRVEKFEGNCLNPRRIAFSYHKNWQFMLTFASLALSFFVTQLLAFGGYFRPAVTMISFDGHFQKIDNIKSKSSRKNMVSIKHLDNY